MMSRYLFVQLTQKVDFSDNPMYEPSFRFYDNKLWDAVKGGNLHVHMFFRLLALCHTVMVEDKDGSLLFYQTLYVHVTMSLNTSGSATSTCSQYNMSILKKMIRR
jgi:hypothetical protein